MPGGQILFHLPVGELSKNWYLLLCNEDPQDLVLRTLGRVREGLLGLSRQTVGFLFVTSLPRYTKNSEGIRIKFLWDFLEAEGRAVLVEGRVVLAGVSPAPGTLPQLVR